MNARSIPTGRGRPSTLSTAASASVSATATNRDGSQCVPYCIEWPRCALCSFRLQDGDEVIAAFDGQAIGRPFPFRLHELYYEENLNVIYHMCCGKTCLRKHLLVQALHASCHDFSVAMTSSSPAYPSSSMASLAYRYNPPHTFEERRAAYFRVRLAGTLKVDLLRRLPLELVSMVADHLVREYAIVYAHEALRHAANPLQQAVSDIELTRDVYATYVRIEDAVYFQSLHNEPLPSEGPNRRRRQRRIFEAGPDDELVRNVYFAFDHLGVRAVCFDTLPSAASVSWLNNIGEVWWLEVARREGLEKLGVDFDGLKIRQFHDLQLTPLSLLGVGARSAWPSPGVHCALIDIETCEPARSAPRSMRVSSTACNEPSIDGYVAALLGSRVAGLRACHAGHRADDDIKMARFYRDMDVEGGDALWMYMPVDSDEYIMEIRVVRSQVSRTRGLMLVTNKDRTALFGEMVSRRLPAGFQMHYLPIPTTDELSLSSLTSSTPPPSRIYFNEYDHINEEKCIRYLGVGNGTSGGNRNSHSREPRSPPANENQSLRRDRYPPSLTPLVERPLSIRDKHPWFYTSCSMDDVVEVTCCRHCRAADNTAEITGMLLRYAGGGRACVGQYRPDRAASPIRADSAQTLSLRLIPVGEFARRVDEVRLRDAASRPPDASWMDVPLSGRLEWWFSLGQSWLSHSTPDS